MDTFDWQFPYPSRRMPVLARNVVATSQPLAAQAGLRILLKGGNAVDAALATAITLAVVEPTSNGIGGDVFAMVWDGKHLQGINASGRSPAAWTPRHFAGKESMPRYGWDSVTVPGAVSGWVSLSERFGALPFADLFEPAITYARDGFIVSPITADRWKQALQTYHDFPGFAEAFVRQGRAPKAGELFQFPDQAHTLERIAETKGKAFYQGDLAEKIVAHAKATGGVMTLEDLATHQADWVDLLAQNYRGFTLHEIPPNGQGLTALMMLGILEHWNLQNFPVDSADSLHLQIEAMKLAFADAYRYIADPTSMDMTGQELLNPDYLSRRAKCIDLKKAQNPRYGVPKEDGTVYLTAADASGMMVSLIQSNYQGFGSGIVVPGTGISLHDRGYGFVLEPGHPNQVGGRKRPFHTIIPGFVTRDGLPVMSFGVMGGPMQPQGHAQMMIRLVDYGQNPQTAADAPRWRVYQEGKVHMEPSFPPAVLDDLRSRGHQITEDPQFWMFGGAQLIYKLDEGYLAASEPRKDGQAVGF
jgi:gamma-glutamyltranspeptidase/glutathione hydrolase